MTGPGMGGPHCGPGVKREFPNLVTSPPPPIYLFEHDTVAATPFRLPKHGWDHEVCIMYLKPWFHGGSGELFPRRAPGVATSTRG